jgi:glutamate/tyrosine decarboxylase-like PLP-dependent enzyme
MKNYLLNGIRKWLDSFPEFAKDDLFEVSEEEFKKNADIFLKRMESNYPFHHPLYAGQMLRPPNEYAAEAYSAAMQINPNNHALDGGPATAEMEKEIVSEYAELFGFPEHLGHLTTSGTIANFEALLIARELFPVKEIAFSEQAHYTHSRVCGWLRIPHIIIKSDQFGRMDLKDLEDKLQTNDIGTVIVTLATTSLGAIDDLEGILKLRDKDYFRIHVDSAYGGYFNIITENNPKFKNFELIEHCDSITFDPHKQGLQPYGCGCVIFKDPTVGKFYKHDSPYTYFTSKDLHLGEISIECSRAGASAAALWFTHQLFPLKSKIGIGPILQRTIDAAEVFADKLNNSPKYALYLSPETNIVTYFPKGKSTSEISELSESLMMKLLEDKLLWIATLKVKSEHFIQNHPEIISDSEYTVILRSCIMKPEQYEWIEQIIRILEENF